LIVSGLSIRRALGVGFLSPDVAWEVVGSILPVCVGVAVPLGWTDVQSIASVFALLLLFRL
jgi:hypothetical protein